jgi:diaminohydroxyphosphoribosylaminopyrimidine deaminase / 5-amino-6-(5-phosphoribosylamino)uracil reductase
MLHENYMQRAVDLAYLGAGAVSPNPMVGAVIVHNNRIIGEGYHQTFGQAHAEVNALASVTDQTLLAESVMYVTLEPCSHYGKTPPCANAIIQSGIRHVVVGITDPNPLVAGKGIQLLKAHGVEVTENVLHSVCSELNKRFITFITEKRPYVILKWAQTDNGFIAPDLKTLGATAFEEQRHITGMVAQKLTHKWRTEEDAIMVGTSTVATDNPKLNARAWNGRQPVRIVLDINNRLPLNSNVFDDSQPTIVLNSNRNLIKVNTTHTTYIAINPADPVAKQVCDVLYQHNIQSLIVEGGARLLQTFIDEGLWHEAQILTAPKRFESGIKAPQPGGIPVAETILDSNHIRIIKAR